MSDTEIAEKRHFFTTTDETSGKFLSKKFARKVHFSADDFEEFSDNFQRMTDELAVWCNAHGRKANALHIEIEAHPWIRKRVRDQLIRTFPQGHPYGDFSRQNLITLLLTDAESHAQQYLVLFKEGKLLAPAAK
jgi:hypothetical protein